MINLLIDFIQFLNTVAPLLFSVAVFTLLAILLSKSIKKYATIYYIVFSIPFFLVVLPFILRLCGIETFNFSSIPLLGMILRDYIHMGTLGFPLLIVIMYMGALDMKNPWVKKLMNIRKELSIISGFPILTHSVVRVFNNFPKGLQYFTNHTGYMENTKVTNEVGAGFTSFAFVLGVVMLALFLVLWITSFDSVHKKMGGKKWKKVQKWSYVLYACLFIHAMSLQVGYLLNPRQRDVPKPKVEATANTDTRSGNENGRAQSGRHATERSSDASARPQSNSERRAESQAETKPTEGGRQNAESKVQAENRGSQGEVQAPARNARPQSKGFSDINVSTQAKRYIHIASLILIFGSYLYLRLRKAKKDAAKKKSKSVEANA